ncbi:MAG: AAA domain-containing protein [Candidatus Gracilibacteria bacterium]|nr:AAA domain-containing protein [Candidatus Gracilibacteria bacterium]
MESQIQLSTEHILARRQLDEYLGAIVLPIALPSRKGSELHCSFIRDPDQEEKLREIVATRRRSKEKEVFYGRASRKIQVKKRIEEEESIAETANRMASPNDFYGSLVLQEGDRVGILDGSKQLLACGIVKTSSLAGVVINISNQKLQNPSVYGLVRMLVTRYLREQTDTLFKFTSDRFSPLSSARREMSPAFYDDVETIREMERNLIDHCYHVDESNPSKTDSMKMLFTGTPSWRFDESDLNYVGEKVYLSPGTQRKLENDADQKAAFETYLSGVPLMQVQGPAGTGKTTLIAAIAEHASNKGQSVRILSHSNRAVDSALETCLKNGLEDRVRRGGRAADSVSSILQPYRILKDLKIPDFPHRSNFPRLSGPEYNEKVTEYNKAYRAYEKKLQQRLENLRRFQEKEEKGIVSGSTLNSFVTDEILAKLNSEIVIVDESSKCFLYELLPAFRAKGVKQVILVGDHKQLCNIELDKHFRALMKEDPKHPESFQFTEEQLDFFEGSPFYFLREMLEKGLSEIPNHILRTNRRSAKAIVAINNLHYNGELIAGKEDKGEVVFIDTSSKSSGEKQVGTSWKNVSESQIAADLLYQEVLSLGNNWTERLYALQSNPKAVGVISPYQGQIKTIAKQVKRKLLHSKYSASEKRALVKFLIKNSIVSVDAAQGDEFDTVITSLVRSHEEEQKGIGHVANQKRLNVACSRARNKLVLIGDVNTLTERNPDQESQAFFEKLLHTVNQVGHIIEMPEKRADLRELLLTTGA